MGESNGTPLQYSCLEIPMDGGAWWAAIYGVAQSRTWLKQPSSSSSNSSSVWDECNYAVVWAFFGTAFPWYGMKTDIFQSCGHCRVFQICWHIECSTLTTSSFSIWYSTAGIPSLTLGLFVVILRPSWLHTPGYLALGEWPRHHGYLGH